MAEPPKPPGLPEALVQKFLDKFAEHIDKNIGDAIAKVFDEKTVDYLRLAMALFPKHMQTGSLALEAMSDADLAGMLAWVKDRIGKEEPSSAN